MSDVIRLSLGEKKLISDYLQFRLEYLKAHFDIDTFYREEYERMKKMNEKELLFLALNQAVCDYKYKCNYED